MFCSLLLDLCKIFYILCDRTKEITFHFPLRLINLSLALSFRNKTAYAMGDAQELLFSALARQLLLCFLNARDVAVPGANCVPKSS